VSAEASCPLCLHEGGQAVWRGPDCRVVRVTGEEALDFPGFYRVIWNAHRAEWTDLTEAEQRRCMHILNAVERALRTHLQPTKVNLAALGNAVPHLHWHVVARYDWDSRFPAPLWAPAQRPTPEHQLVGLRAGLAACDAAIARGLF
jgi:diadenosine tetraphosphate (Ap4A) HIT family hydrolase